MKSNTSDRAALVGRRGRLRQTEEGGGKEEEAGAGRVEGERKTRRTTSAGLNNEIYLYFRICCINDT